MDIIVQQRRRSEGLYVYIKSELIGGGSLKTFKQFF